MNTFSNFPKKQSSSIHNQLMMGKENSSGISQSQVEQRIQILESNLSRVCLQQDALMPLLQMTEVLPQINRSENNMKQLQKRIEENESKLQKQEKNLEKKFKDINNQEKLQKTDQKYQKQIEEMTIQIKDLENNFQNVYRWYEAKLKEESYSIQRSLEQKIEKQRTEYNQSIEEVRKSKCFIPPSQDQTNNLEKMKGEIIAAVKLAIGEEIQQKGSQQINELKNWFEQEVRNIYKEIGLVKSEIEFVTNFDRKQRIIDKIQKLPREIDQQEKQFKINVFEQETFILDLENFNRENAQRIQYEIDQINNDLENMQILMSQEQLDTQLTQEKLTELDFLMERQINLKYQVQGIKKKYALEVKKIENKFNILSQLNQEMKSNQNLKADFEKINAMDNEIKSILANINLNIESSTQNLQQLGDKINEVRENLSQLSQKLEI